MGVGDESKEVNLLFTYKGGKLVGVKFDDEWDVSSLHFLGSVISVALNRVLQEESAREIGREGIIEKVVRSNNTLVETIGELIKEVDELKGRTNFGGGAE